MRLDAPLEIVVDGMSRRGVVMKQGKPFEVTARNIARMMGLPDYPFVMVEHPIGSRTLPEIKMLAESAYEQAVPILGG